MSALDCQNPYALLNFLALRTNEQVVRQLQESGESGYSFGHGNFLNVELQYDMRMPQGRLLGLICIAATTLASADQSELASHGRAFFVPDRDRTPGIINQFVTTDNIIQTICVPGWTATIRPPTSYTNRLKVRQMREMRLSGKVSDYEEDHLVPLCVGGHPTDQRNLWPEPREGRWAAKFKDQLEASVCRAVCQGAMTLEEGQRIFLRPDWTQEYIRFFHLE